MRGPDWQARPVAPARGPAYTGPETSGSTPLRTWSEIQADLADMAARQLFFVGGAPRSGTTWLQYLLDSHPDICCRGEAAFMHNLSGPLTRMVADWRDGLAAKNKKLFAERGGYPLPPEDEAQALIGAAILLALARQPGAGAARAVGEKTPENVFHFAQLKQLFPAAKFVGIARDPRDVLTSAWHFFQTSQPGRDETVAKLAFVRGALPALNSGTRTMLGLLEKFPGDCAVVTYERMRAEPAAAAAALFRFLGVSAAPDVVADCVARTSFPALSGGRAAGDARDGAFFRKGVSGDWRGTLDDACNSLILQELGWMFPRFGWVP